MSNWEYCTVFYQWKGLGLTQEIDTILLNGEELNEWRGKHINEFLNSLGHTGWEIAAAIPNTPHNLMGCIFYCKKQC